MRAALLKAPAMRICYYFGDSRSVKVTAKAPGIRPVPKNKPACARAIAARPLCRCVVFRLSWCGRSPACRSKICISRSAACPTVFMGTMIRALLSAMLAPGDYMDLYVRDRYFVIRKLYVWLTLCAVTILPLAVWIVKRFRSAK